MSSPNLSEMVTTTLRNRSKKLADNVTRRNALLMRLKNKKMERPISGGRTILEELEYAQNSTAMWFSGYESLNTSPSNVFSAAEFNLRQAAVAVSISGLERLQNSGPEAVIDLLESRIGNAEKTMMNLIAAGVYSNGSNTKQIGGLQFLVSDSPATGVVGGINRATWTFWQNLVYSAVGNGGTAATSANIQSYMNSLYLQLCGAGEGTDLIVADNAFYQLYWQSLQSIARVTPADEDVKPDIGFRSLKYAGADVVFDGGFQGYSTDVNPAIGGAPANHMYFLNTDYLKYRPHRDCNMVPLEPGERFSTNQDALVKILGWAGNLTISNCRMQGVLKS